MHKIFLNGDQITLSTKGYRKKIMELKLMGEISNAQVYINPNSVENDDEYIYLLSLKDKNTKYLQSLGNRFDIDEYFKVLDLLDILDSYK